MLKIKELREEKELSQKELAKKIDTDQTNICRWEKGKNQPTYIYLIKLAEFFGVSVEYLIGKEDDSGIKTKTISITENINNLTVEEKKLIEQFRSFGPDARKLAIIQFDTICKIEEKEKIKI